MNAETIGFWYIIFLIGFIFLYPKIKKEMDFKKRTEETGSPLLANCKTPSEVISTKCIFDGAEGMPKLTQTELRVIEAKYKEAGGLNQTYRSAYKNQTGNDLSKVVNKWGNK